MATCNLFIKELTKETGTFLTFSQYIEDITKHSGMGETYKVIPSSFITFDIDYSRTSSDFLVRLQNEFENGCACCRNKMQNWTPSHSTNLFWNAFVKIFKSKDSISTSNNYSHVHKGSINFQSSDIIDGTNYSDIYCHIPNDGLCEQLTIQTNTSGISIESNNTIEGYPEQTLSEIIKYYPEAQSSLSLSKEQIDKFNINTIVVFYDIYDSSDTKCYSDIPMGIYFTGKIDNGNLTNSVTKYITSDTIYGIGTSYGLHICSKYICSTGDLNLTVSQDNDSAKLSKVLEEISDNQILMKSIINNFVENQTQNKSFYAGFKNNRANVPYVVDVGNENYYWYVNGRQVAPVVATAGTSVDEVNAIVTSAINVLEKTLEGEYLSKEDAGTKYLTIEDADEKYLSTADLSVYLKIVDAANTYLSKTEASSTYMTKTEGDDKYASKNAIDGFEESLKNIDDDLKDTKNDLTTLEQTLETTNNELSDIKINSSNSTHYRGIIDVDNIEDVETDEYNIGDIIVIGNDEFILDGDIDEGIKKEWIKLGNTIKLEEDTKKLQEDTQKLTDLTSSHTTDITTIKTNINKLQTQHVVLSQSDFNDWEESGQIQENVFYYIY